MRFEQNWFWQNLTGIEWHGAFLRAKKSSTFNRVAGKLCLCHVPTDTSFPDTFITLPIAVMTASFS